MLSSVTIKGVQYEFVKNYKTHKSLRDSFNLLTQQVYRFNFEPWFELGYWGDSYQPYSLMKDNKVIANVSINIIDFSFLGETKRCLQIGTVMTDEAYRNLGLSRCLMELIMNEWAFKCDLIYLFANHSVLDFYPKFGFVPVREYSYTKSAPFSGIQKEIRKLDMSMQNNRELLYDMVSSTKVFSKISMLDNANLVMFYCTSFMSDYVYYIEEYKAIVIAEHEEGVCYLHDVFCKEEIFLDDIIVSIVNENISKVILGFAPVDVVGYNIDLLADDIDVLFVKPDIAELFKINQLRFSVLSHA